MLRVVCLATLLASCGGADQTPFLVTHDPCGVVVLVPAGDTTPAEEHSAREAARLWNERAGTQVTLDDPAPEDASISRVPLTFGDAAGFYFGRYEDDVGAIFVNRRVSDPTRRAIVIAHELGHAFGLLHVEHRRSIMEPGNLDQEPTAEDRAALAERATCALD